MINLMSKRQMGNPVSYARVNMIWHVDADSTYYNVKRLDRNMPNYIAVRTVGGCGTLTEFGGKKHRLKTDTLGIFRSEDVAEYGAEAEGWHFYWFRFDQDNWRDGVNWVAELGIRASEQKQMERCFVYLNSTISEECKLAESLFNYLLSDWMMRCHTNAKGDLSRQKLVPLLERSWREKIGMAELAKEVGMSERGFRNVVYQTCGMSPKNYLTKLKMEAAMELLQTTNRSVTEISQDLNFENPFYFSRVFKKYYGISPSQARDTLLPDDDRKIP